MDNIPDPPFSLEGPAFAQRVREAEEVTQTLQNNQWNFAASPKIFAIEAGCDVIAKEMVFIHNGHMQTRIGRLVMAGVGSFFNLMGPESARSQFKMVSSHILDEINRQIGSKGLYDFQEFQKYTPFQEVDFLSPSIFYQLRDLVFYGALYGGGLFPSGFENFSRSIAAGKIIHNVVFVPPMPSSDPGRPVSMMATPLSVQVPTPVVEWMEKPIYGGIVKETLHIINLLTLEPTRISHPFLPFVGEGRIVYGHQRYYLRRFVGISPKEGLRGPGVPSERASQKDESSQGGATT